MGDLSIRRVSVILLVLVLVQSIFLLARGGLLIHQHEVDTVHMIDILVRMHGGEVPHLDFMTPIGVLAFAPVVVFMKAGLPAGMAIVAAQVLIAALLMAPVIYVIRSRMQGWGALGFGTIVLMLVLALIHGGTNDVTSVSMHYNRWAWAVAFLVIAIGFLTRRSGGTDFADGVITGVGFAVLALTKMTYFAAFALPVAMGFILRRQYKALAVSLISGALIAGVLTVFTGFSFWQAYLNDLLVVAGSELRPFPGVSFSGAISSPAYLSGSVALFLSVILLRKAGRSKEGILLLMLAPGFFYVTWQNYGNDPQWLLLLPVLLATQLPLVAGNVVLLQWRVRDMLAVTLIVSASLSLPGFVNLAKSPLRNFFADRGELVQLVPGDARFDDVLMYPERFENVQFRGALDLGEGTPQRAENTDEVSTVVNGEVLISCELTAGLPAWKIAISNQLLDAGLGHDAQLFVADLSSSIWIYGPFSPVPGAAPWQYGDLAGVENASHLLVPLCPTSKEARKLTLDRIQEHGIALREAARSGLFILFEMDHLAENATG